MIANEAEWVVSLPLLSIEQLGHDAVLGLSVGWSRLMSGSGGDLARLNCLLIHFHILSHHGLKGAHLIHQSIDIRGRHWCNWLHVSAKIAFIGN